METLLSRQDTNYSTLRSCVNICPAHSYPALPQAVDSREWEEEEGGEEHCLKGAGSSSEGEEEEDDELGGGAVVDSRLPLLVLPLYSLLSPGQQAKVYNYLKVKVTKFSGLGI